MPNFFLLNIFFCFLIIAIPIFMQRTSYQSIDERKFNLDEKTYSRYFKKGSALCVTGSIQTRSWQDQQGQKRYITEGVVDEVNFVDSKGEGPTMGGYTPDSYQTPGFASDAGAPRFEEMSNDDDLPF